MARELGYPAGEAAALEALGPAPLTTAATMTRRYGWACRPADHGGRPRGHPARQRLVDHRADRSRGPGRRPGRRRGRAGLVPGCRRRDEAAAAGDDDGGPGPAGGPYRGRRRAGARGAADRRADRQLGRRARRPVVVRARVHGGRAVRRDRHGVGRQRRIVPGRGAGTRWDTRGGAPAPASPARGRGRRSGLRGCARPRTAARR